MKKILFVLATCLAFLSCCGDDPPRIDKRKEACIRAGGTGNYRYRKVGWTSYLFICEDKDGKEITGVYEPYSF